MSHSISPFVSRRSCLATAIFLLNTGALAQQSMNPGPSLPAVVVNGSPIIESNNVDSFSSLTTQVTDTQVKDLGALDLAAALRMTPGVQISRYNEVGSYSGDQGGNVYVRGIGASRPGSEIKTYLDGVPVYMGVWNHPLMDLLPLQGVKSIDIHKGPQNGVNGNNFASINLQSKRATREGIQGELNVSTGSYATKTLQANVVGRVGELEFALAGGHVASNGARQNADSALNNAMGRLSFRLNNAWTMGGSFLTVDNQVGDPGDNRFAVSASAVGPYSFSNGIGRNESAMNLFTVFLSHQHGDWSGEVKIYENRGHNNLKNDASWGSFDSNFTMSGLRWKERLSPWRAGELVLGVDLENISGKVSGPHVGAPVGTPFGFGTSGSARVPDFEILSSYAGLSQKIDLNNGWTAQPSLGVRIYHSNHYAGKAAPNAGISFTSEAVTVYANRTDGLLYPGAETYTLTRAIPMAFAPDNGWDRLSPTQDRHHELGVQWQAGAGTNIDVSVFQDDISKRYVWTGFFPGAILNPASGVWSNNFPTYVIRGSEVSVRHRINHQWSMFGGVTSLRPSLANLPYAPRNAVSVGVTGEVAGYRLSFDAQHQGRMYSLTQDRGTFAPNEVGAFTAANARIARALAVLGKSGEVYLAMNNLFDAHYQFNAGYPMPGRNYRLGLIAKF